MCIFVLVLSVLSDVKYLLPNALTHKPPSTNITYPILANVDIIKYFELLEQVTNSLIALSLHTLINQLLHQQIRLR